MTAKKKAAPKKTARTITEARLVELLTDMLPDIVMEATAELRMHVGALAEKAEYLKEVGEERHVEVRKLAAEVGQLQAWTTGAMAQGQVMSMKEPRLMDLPGLTPRDMEPHGRSLQEDAMREKRTTAPPTAPLIDERSTVFGEALARLEENTRRVTQIRRELCGYNERLYGEQPTTAGVTGYPDLEGDGYVYQLIRACAYQADMLTELDQELDRLNGLA